MWPPASRSIRCRRRCWRSHVCWSAPRSSCRWRAGPCPPARRSVAAMRGAWCGWVSSASPAPSAFSHWGLARSTASNGALLIIVEPVAIMLLGPVLLGERLTRREAAGAALAVLGAVIVVVDGVPGVTQAVAPYWRGDLLLVLSGLGYASYSLIGRDVLARHSATAVTARSIVWGTVAMVPLALVEWQAGGRPVVGPRRSRRRSLPRSRDHRARIPGVELGTDSDRRLARGDLHHGAADRRCAAGRRPAARAAHRVHAGWRRADRGRTLVDGDRSKLTVY